MWSKVDSLLEKYYKQYKNENKYLQDNLQKIFDSVSFNYSQLYNLSNSKELMKFRRILEREKEKVLEDSYIYYMINNYLQLKNIRNVDILRFLIYLEYYHSKLNMDEYEKMLFNQVVYEGYIQSEKEIKPKDKILDIPNIIMLGLNNFINNLGYEWNDYKESITKYNSEELSRQLIMNMASNRNLDIDNIEFQKLIEKQQKRQINIHDDKISGAIENQVDNIFNYAKLETGKQYGVDKCRFIAEIDKRTTEMCETLNNQIFSINDWNTYQRYSNDDKRVVIYKTFGLKVGDNLPPINNHFHYCRSTITYQIDMPREMLNKNLMTWDEKNALFKFLGGKSIILNEKMRAKSKLTKDERQFKVDLYRALNKIPNYDGNIVRVVDIKDTKILNMFLEEYKVGKKIKFNQFTSFSNKSGYNDNANINIWVKDSKKAKNVIEYSQESEVLYQYGVGFKVLNVTFKNGKYYVLLEEL